MQAERDGLARALAGHLVRAFRRLGDAVLDHPSLKALPDPDAIIPEDSAAELRRVLRAGHAGAVEAGTAAATGLVGSFDLPQAEVQRVLDELGERIRGIDEATRADVRRIVGQAAADGAGIPELRDRLRGLFAETYRGRAETIALTETAVAFNLGSLLAYEESGVVGGVTVLDGDGDADCASVNGTRQTIAWARANPVAHPNCRRAFAPIVD